MEYDTDKVDDYTLALLFLVMWKEDGAARAWKGFDWDTLDRLCEKGYISDPKGKAKSIYVTPEGYNRAQGLFAKLFENQNQKDQTI